MIDSVIPVQFICSISLATLCFHHDRSVYIRIHKDKGIHKGRCTPIRGYSPQARSLPPTLSYLRSRSPEGRLSSPHPRPRCGTRPHEGRLAAQRPGATRMPQTRPSRSTHTILGHRDLPGLHSVAVSTRTTTLTSLATGRRRGSLLGRHRATCQHTPLHSVLPLQHTTTTSPTTPPTTRTTPPTRRQPTGSLPP